MRKARAIWEFLGDLAGGRRKTFVLGAGASAGLVPTIGELIPRLVSLADDRPLYVSAQKDLPPYAKLAANEVETDPWRRELLWCMSLVAWNVRYDRVLVPDVPQGTVPGQYAFFRLVPAPLAIVTTNTDGLAKRFCPRIPVAELHGSITNLRLDGRTWRVRQETAIRLLSWLPEDEEIELAQEWEWRPVEPRIVRPGDPEVLEGWGPWMEGERLLATADVIVFVGYSFPDTDPVVLDLVEAAGRHDKWQTIWVVDPAPDTVVAKVEVLLRAPAKALICKWNQFSGAVVEVARRRRLRSLQAVRAHADDVADLIDGCVLMGR